MCKEEKLEVFYVRHADTIGADYVDKECRDVDITEKGVRQAELLGERFKGAHFDAVLVSPMTRCVKTAAAICNNLDIKPTMELIPALVEKGTEIDYIGMEFDFLKGIYPDIIYCKDNVYGGKGSYKEETKPEAMERARAVIEYIKKRFTFGQKVLVVSHAAFGNSFLPSAVGIKEETQRFTLYNTSVSKVKYTPDGVERISFMNDCSHLLSVYPDFQFEI